MLVACAPEAAHTIQLRPDPRLNTPEEIVRLVSRLELVLDGSSAPGGVSSPGAAGDFEAVDLDGDGVLELRVRRPVEGVLPSFRLDPGSDPDWSFGLSAWGLDGAGQRAAGGTLPVSLAAAPELLEVPFNLRGELRALRVDSSTPTDGQVLAGPFRTITLALSRPVLAGSVAGLRVSYVDDGGNQVAVPGAWSVSETSVLEWGSPARCGLAVFTLASACVTSPGSYRIEAGSEVRDESGRALDQDASAAGASAFLASFAVAGEPRRGPCSGCQRDADCQNSAGQEARCLDGQCQPPPTGGCPNCQPGQVCQPDSSGGGSCVADCRLQPERCGDPNNESSCDPQSGLCVSSDLCKLGCQKVCAETPDRCQECLQKCPG